MSCQVVLVTVCISTEEVGGVGVQGSYLFNMFLQPSKSSNKLLFFSSSWEVYDSMKGSNCSWKFKQDSKEARGICWQHSYKWVERQVPHCHSATIGPDALQGDIRIVGIFRVKVRSIAPMEWLEEGGKTGLVDHGFSEKNYGRFELLGENSQ